MTDINSAKGQLLKFEEMRKEMGAEEPSKQDAAFGVTLEKSASLRTAAANQQISSFVDNLVMDNSLPGYVATIDGMVLHVNDQYRDLAERVGDSCLSPGPLQIMNKMPSPTLQPVINDVMASGTTVKSSEKLVHRGKKYIFEGRHMPVHNARGDVIAVAGTYEDVTSVTLTVEEARQTQARFQDFARASSDWLWELDDELKVKSLSDRFTAVVGQPAMMYIGSKMDQVGLFKENLSGNNDGESALAQHKPFRDQLFVMHDHTGKEQLFHLSGVPVFNRHSGDFIGYRGVGKDVSQRYSQAEGANKAKDMLEEALADLTRNNIELDIAKQNAQSALKAKNEFLASMTHELKTPLNAIIGFSESFTGQQFGDLSESYLTYAHDINDAGKHLLALINDVLDVTLMETDSLKLQETSVSVRALVHRASHFLACQAVEKQVQLVADDIDDSLYLRGDEKRVMQILINLLTNAVKFTPAQGKVGIEVASSGSDNLRLTVWDTGIGIAPENHGKIFEKFHQVTEDVYAREQNGTGLGLHISHGLAKTMGGDLQVESQMGQGARFTLTLPLVDEDSDDDFDFI